jgi:hypothetical protein
MEVMSVIASGIAVGCIAIAVVICVWVALGNVDILLKSSEEWEDGE